MAKNKPDPKNKIGKARALSSTQVEIVLDHLEKRSRYPSRDISMFLFSCKAGLRSVEIAGLEWCMIYDLDGNIHKRIDLPARITKGGTGERVIPMHKQLHAVLLKHHDYMKPYVKHTDRIFLSERGFAFDRKKMSSFFHRLYKRLGFHKCSSHSGRRTFITDTARQIIRAGGSLKEIQEMAGHKSLETTELYIEVNEGAKQRVIDLI